MPTRVTVLLLCSLAAATALSGQSPFRQNTSLRVGLGLVHNAYYGDLSDPNDPFPRVYPGVNFSLQPYGSNPFHLQLNAGFGKVAAQRDMNDIPHVPGIVRVNFVETSFFYSDLRLKYRFFHKKYVQPYVSAGAGFFIFSPKDRNGKFLSEAIRTRPEGENYNTSIPQLPLSAGVQARITRLVWAGIDYTYRIVPTDYIDNIGALGSRAGNDRLHALQMTLYFNMSGKEPVKRSVPKPVLNPLLSFEIPLADTLIRRWVAPDTSEAPEPGPMPDEKPAAESKSAQPDDQRNAAQAPGISLNLPALQVRPQKSKAFPFVRQIKAAPPELVPAVRSRPRIQPAPGPAAAYIDSLMQAFAKESAMRSAFYSGNIYYYEMKAGDSYERVCRQHHINFDMLEEFNPVVASGISPVGARLRLPDLKGRYELVQTNKPAQPKVALSPQLTAEWQKLEEKAIQEDRFMYYQIKKGDTLEALSVKFKTRISTIQKLNGIDVAPLPEGAYLRLPDLGLRGDEE